MGNCKSASGSPDAIRRGLSVKLGCGLNGICEVKAINGEKQISVRSSLDTNGSFEIGYNKDTPTAKSNDDPVSSDTHFDSDPAESTTIYEKSVAGVSDNEEESQSDNALPSALDYPVDGVGISTEEDETVEDPDDEPMYQLNPDYTPQTTLEKIMYTFPQIDWVHWSLISRHSKITEGFIGANMDLPWVWGLNGVSRNENISVKFVEDHPEKEWDWGRRGLSMNSSVITPEYIKSHPEILEKLHWGDYGLSMNSSITLDFLDKFIDNPWNFGKNGLSMNPRIFDTGILEKYADKPWDYGERGMSRNRLGLTIDFFENHTKEDWKFRFLSSHRNFTPEYFHDHPEYPWEWDAVCMNPNLTKEFIEKFKEKYDLSTIYLLRNPSISGPFAKQHLKARSSFTNDDIAMTLLCNPSLDFSIINESLTFIPEQLNDPETQCDFLKECFNKAF